MSGDSRRNDSGEYQAVTTRSDIVLIDPGPADERGIIHETSHETCGTRVVARDPYVVNAPHPAATATPAIAGTSAEAAGRQLDRRVPAGGSVALRRVVRGASR